MTVNLEDYYCDLRLSMWSTYSSRICGTTRDILKVLRKSNALAAFFTLGYLAERHPELIEETISQGHEVAIHGHFHVNFKNKAREDFDQDLVKSLEVLRTVAQEKTRGFGAPFFSINIEYDSITFPLKMHNCSSGVPNHIYMLCDQDRFKIDDIKKL
jgi:peptidoglycan-N-acetylglucosamine deacetylase